MKNFDRAKKFYEIILDAGMKLIETTGVKSVFFPAEIELGGISGCIIKGKGMICHQMTVIWMG